MSILNTSPHKCPGRAQPLVVLIGPTAVGKTELSLSLAERLNGEIISADSRLFYRGMDIGTAKPTLQERQRVPHHLIDVTDPDQPWSLTAFQSAAHMAIVEIWARGHLPLLVGGTGQYVRAVIEGWEAPPQEPDNGLRVVLEDWAAELGPYALHDRLRVVDPAAAQFIDARNMRRTIRALEVTLRSGRRFSDQRVKRESPYDVLTIGLYRPRPELYQRVDQRIEAMLAAGWLDEVRALYEKGYAGTLPGLSAIGYRELGAVLRGEMTLEEAVIQIKRLTRRFVRHQGAWFHLDDPQIHWFAMQPDPLEAVTAGIHTWCQGEDFA